MRTYNETPIDNLFANKSFFDAIGMKDAELVKSFIRKICKIHLDENLNSPWLKINKTKDSDYYEELKHSVFERFEKDIDRLTDFILESCIGKWPDHKINPESLISIIRHEYGDIVQFYYSIGGPAFQRHRYDLTEYTGLKEDEVEFFKLTLIGDTDNMLEMINNGVNPNAKTEDLTTALMVAVEYGHQNAAEMLLKFKADIHAREMLDAESEGKGVTAMNLAALNKDRTMIDLLLKYGGDINEKAGCEGESPFLIAVYSGDYDFMDFVLKHGADVNIEQYNGGTGLIHAASTNDVRLASYLLDKGADINHLNITGLTALDIARNLGGFEMIDFLLKAGANNEDRMLEHLVTYRQDLYVWDNDIAYAYYHWSTDDGFSHFLIYGIGFLNKMLALSELRRFYIRVKGDEIIETYAGDDHLWFHYVLSKNGEVVGEKFNKCSHGFYGNLICPDDSMDFDDASAFAPENSKQLDFESKYENLSDFFRNFVSFVEEHDESAPNDKNEKYIFARYSKKGWNFFGPYWERRSVNVKDEHEKLITDLLLEYFVY